MATETVTLKDDLYRDEEGNLFTLKRGDPRLSDPKAQQQSPVFFVRAAGREIPVKQAEAAGLVKKAAKPADKKRTPTRNKAK